MRLLRQSEIHRLTGSRDPRVQMRVLVAAGVQPIVREDGRLVVAEEAVLQAMRVTHTERVAPNWEAIA